MSVYSSNESIFSAKPYLAGSLQQSPVKDTSKVDDLQAKVNELKAKINTLENALRVFDDQLSLEENKAKENKSKEIKSKEIKAKEEQIESKSKNFIELNQLLGEIRNLKNEFPKYDEYNKIEIDLHKTKKEFEQAEELLNEKTNSENSITYSTSDDEM